MSIDPVPASLSGTYMRSNRILLHHPTICARIMYTIWSSTAHISIIHVINIYAESRQSVSLETFLRPAIHEIKADPILQLRRRKLS